MSEATVMQKIKTSKIAAFLNIGTTAAPKWERIRKQSELKLKYDAETEEDTFIDEDAPTTSVLKYAVGFEGALTCHNGDPVFEYLDDIRQNRKVGIDCETECLVVYMYSDNTNYKTEKNKCSVTISEFGGTGGGGIASMNYSVNFNGDPTLGTATVTDDGTVNFSEATEVTEATGTTES